MISRYTIRTKSLYEETLLKLKFLPANTTSKSQPMDQCIIQTIKLKFCKRQLRHVISEMEKDKSKCGSELLKNINILQAIYWINRSWQEVETSTIQKCFAKCGFTDFSRDDSAFNQINDMSDSEEEDDDIPLKFISLARKLFNCEYHKLSDVDKQLATLDISVRNWERPAYEILADIDDQSTASDNDDNEETEPPKACSLSELDFDIQQIKNFALVNGRQRLLNAAIEMEDDTADLRISSVKQTRIEDFL